MMSRRIIDILSALVTLIIGVVMVYSTKNMSAVIPNDVGPGFLPKVIGICLIGLAVLKLIFSIKDNNHENIGGMQLMGRGLITILVTGVYVSVFRNLGFIISSTLYLMVQIFILKQDEKVSKKTVLAVSIISPVVIYFIFVKLLNLMLPAGVLG
jgi:hypothetical protein